MYTCARKQNITEKSQMYRNLHSIQGWIVSYFCVFYTNKTGKIKGEKTVQLKNRKSNLHSSPLNRRA